MARLRRKRIIDRLEAECMRHELKLLELESALTREALHLEKKRSKRGEHYAYVQ